MRSYVISTDSSADLSEAYLKDNHDFFELHLKRKDLQFRESDHTKTVV